MLSVFDGPWRVEYSQFYLSDAGPLLVGESFAGQANGLCGAADPGGLLCVTGLHTGPVHVRITLLDRGADFDTPPSGDCVEASCAVTGEWALLSFAGESASALALPQGVYRVRYSAHDMDAGRLADLVGHRDSPIDAYELQFRPSETIDGDEIVQVVSDTAAAWHESVQTRVGLSPDDPEPC